MKRIISLILAILMMVSMFAFTDSVQASSPLDPNKAEDVTLALDTYTDMNVSITKTGEYLIYKLVAPENGYYSFYTQGGQDTYGYLFNSTTFDINNPYMQDDDSGDGSNCRLTTFMEKDFSMYFAVKYYDARNTNLSLDVTIDRDTSYGELTVIQNVIYEKSEVSAGVYEYVVLGVSNLTSLKDINILSEIGGIPVTIIAENAFRECKYIKSVYISKNIEYIYNGAFYKCPNLMQVTNTFVKYIGERAFSNCEKLVYINLPNTIQYYGERAFANTCLTSVALLGSDAKLCGELFANCALDKVTIGTGIKSMDLDTFEDASIKEFVVADESPYLKAVDKNLYSKDGKYLLKYASYQRKDESFTIPSGVETIYNYAFQNADNLKSVSFPSSVKTVEALAFNSCTKLESLTLNEGLQTIGTYAFAKVNLKDVKLPSTLVTLSDGAFSYTKIVSAVVPSNVTILGEYVFESSYLKEVIFYNDTCSIDSDFTDGAKFICKSGSSAEAYANSHFFEYETFETGSSHSHVYVVDKITKEATCTKEGQASTKCLVCSTPGESVSLDCVEHDLVNGLCTTCNTSTAQVYELKNEEEKDVLIISSGRAVGVYTVNNEYRLDIDLSTNEKVEIDITIKDGDAWRSWNKSLTLQKGESKEVTAYVEKGQKVYISYNSASRRNVHVNTTVSCSHQYGHMSGKAPTCTQAGYSSYTSCNYCGKVFQEKTVIPAIGHQYTNKVVKPTYLAKGYTLHTCSECGYSYKDNYKNKLVLAKPGSVKLTAVSKGFKLTYKKVSAANGYQIQYSTSSKFKSKKTVTITKNSTLSKTVKKLTSKKKYYVRIRSYKTVSGKKVYSSWTTKSITTK